MGHLAKKSHVKTEKTNVCREGLRKGTCLQMGTGQEPAESWRGVGWHKDLRL